MQTVFDVRDGALYQIWLAEAGGQGQGKEDKTNLFRALSDVVEFSAEAAQLLKEEGPKQLARKATSMESIHSRIAAIKEEIARIWNGPLPDKEKNLQIQGRETEISLLQAGLFEFAKAGFSVSV
jgi:hypothetical protein